MEQRKIWSFYQITVVLLLVLILVEQSLTISLLEETLGYVMGVAGHFDGVTYTR